MLLLVLFQYFIFLNIFHAFLSCAHLWAFFFRPFVSCDLPPFFSSICFVCIATLFSVHRVPGPQKVKTKTRQRNNDRLSPSSSPRFQSVTVLSSLRPWYGLRFCHFFKSVFFLSNFTTVAGWGKVEHPGTASQLLQQAQLPLVSKAACDKQNTNYKIHKRMLCAGDVSVGNEVNGCHGDSGGPLVCRKGNGKYALEGVVSWGSKTCNFGTSDKMYTVFTRVSEYRQWIDRKMNEWRNEWMNPRIKEWWMNECFTRNTRDDCFIAKSYERQ